MDAVWIRVIAAAVIAYLCGCFNGAVIVSKYILRDDVRTHGSGNAGLTNFYRTFGGPLTFVVILTDVLKAVVALLIGRWLLVGHLPALAMLMNAPEQAYSDYWCGLFCLLGHMFPCMFQFKGGKGILSGGTIVWMIDWRIGLVVWVGFLPEERQDVRGGRPVHPALPADPLRLPGLQLHGHRPAHRYLVRLSRLGAAGTHLHHGRADPLEAPEQHRPSDLRHGIEIQLPPQGGGLMQKRGNRR